MAEAVKAALLQDDTIDAVITLNAGDANSVATAVIQAGASERVQLAAFDFDQANLGRIQAGEQLFAIDQQPYLAVSLIDSYVNYGLEVPTAPILTGPAIMDAANLATVLAGVVAGVR